MPAGPPGAAEPPVAPPTAPPTGRWRPLRAAAAVVVVMALCVGVVFVLLLFATLAVPGKPSGFQGGSFTTVERALQDRGLHICHTVDATTVHADQAVETRAYEVALDCENGGLARVVVDRFTSQDDRDSAVRTFEVLVRPNGSGVAYRYHRFSVFVRGSSDDRVQDRINEALRAIGAA